MKAVEWPIGPCRLEALVGPFLLVMAEEEPFDDQNEPDEERNGEQQMAHATTVGGTRRRRPEPSECFHLAVAAIRQGEWFRGHQGGHTDHER